eukprot:TRINITY_DN30186_c0_g1_i1.p1 TRINITY_DN30186_c0_g1~~TRINITY_DN30186_c0_g1_i1.p1  ORF type:complete len:206 (+),score=64.89 TRINITY_DN30186_c0_g1_i1:50-667(+)
MADPSAMRFIERQRGLCRVSADGAVVKISPQELERMCTEVDDAARDYGDAARELRSEQDALERRHAAANRGVWLWGACAAGSATWTATSFYQADAGNIDAHLLNKWPFRSRTSPQLSASGLRPFLRSGVLLRALQVRPAVGALCTVAAAARFALDSRGRVYLSSKMARDARELETWSQEHSKLVALSGELHRVRDTHPAYAAIRK